MFKNMEDGFEHTVSGLLRKRQMLLDEAQRIRDRMAEIKDELPALDKTLRAFGYDGDLDGMMPRQKRHVLFGRGELLRANLSDPIDRCAAGRLQKPFSIPAMRCR